EHSVAAEKDLSPDYRAGVLTFYRSHPASELCRTPGDTAAGFREQVCSPGKDVWQFLVAERVSWAGLLLGVVAVLAAIALGLIAFSSRNAQYWSFMTGWRLLTFVSAAEAVMQGVLGIWLSYWITALLFHVYVIKLIILAAVLGLGAIWISLKAIF